jgi:hypothetical protein
MKKRLIIIGIIALLVMVGSSGCTEENLTPNIQFEKDGRWLRIISVDRELSWNDVNITISVGNYSDIQFSPSPVMSMTYSYENGKACPDNWQSITPGNAIHFLLFNNNITVQLKWISTNKIIGGWNFP